MEARPRSPLTNQTSENREVRSPEAALGAFGRSLRREVVELGSADFDELRRAVDGELDLSEQALWSERIAREPLLARREADLRSFRDEIGANGRVLTFRRPPARVSLSGWVAAAAVLLLAVAMREVPRAIDRYGSLSAAASQLIQEPVFSDGFEAGDASGWSSISPSG